MEQDLDWNSLTPSEKAGSLADMAAQAELDGCDQLAYGFYTQSLNLYRGFDDRINVLKLLIKISSILLRADFGDGQDMFARRRKMGEEALPLAREIGNISLQASALSAFAVGMPVIIAKPMLHEAIALAEACGDKAILALALSRLAHQADIGYANTLNQRALELYKEIEDKAGMARILYSISIRANRMDKRKYLEQALELQRKLGAKKQIVQICMRLESICDPREYAQKEAYTLEALEKCRQIDKPIWQSHALKRLAKVAMTKGDNARAQTLVNESISVYQHLDIDPTGEEILNDVFGCIDFDKMIEIVKHTS